MGHPSEKNMGHPSEKNTSYFIYFAALATSLTGFATGVVLIWPSPFLPKFQSTDPEINPIGRPITTSESAWIVSVTNLGMTCGPLLSLLISNFFTKKTLLIMYMVPIFLSHCIFAFATTPILFIFGRYLSGLGLGAILTVLGSFIAEISEERIRGKLCSIPSVISCFGSLSLYIFGPYMAMTYFSLVNLVPIVLFFILFGFFVPSSPYDLLMQKKFDQAEQSLKKLRGNDVNITKELLFIEEYINTSQDRVSFKVMLKDRALRKGLMICMSLMAIQQFSGFMIVGTYAEVIFKLAGDAIPSNLSAVVMSVTSTMGIFLAFILIDRMGRKLLLTLSCGLKSVCLFALGLYFFLLDSGTDVSKLSWLPVLSIILAMVSFNLGMAMVPWVVTGEVFHTSVKPLAINIVSLTNFILGFAITMGYPYVVEYIGMAWTFWAFALSMALSAIFSMVVLPETKGKNFQEILDILKK